MKRLLLIRHAKAEQGSSFNDFERPLKPRGIEDAQTISLNLRNKNIVPQMILSSPALRALATAQVFAENLSVDNLQTEKTIYEASDSTLLKIINNLSDDHSLVALVGHNPGFEQIISYLTGEYRSVPTCSATLITFEVEKWAEVSNTSGSLTFYSEP
jgi:phosphohistidine phosphatase